MNEDPKIQEYLLKIDDDIFKFTVQLDQQNDKYCEDCAIGEYCQKASASAVKSKTNNWIVTLFPPCYNHETFDSAVIFDYKKEIVQKSDNFLIFSPQDIRKMKADRDEFVITPSTIFNSFCRPFCPIKKDSVLSCFSSVECPFREVFKKAGVDILYLPKDD